MTSPGTKSIQPDWLSKSIAGLLLGLLLALGLSGLLSLALSPLVSTARTQLVMWSVMPTWMAVLGGCFLFRTGARAWLWLGSATALAWGAFLALRTL